MVHFLAFLHANQAGEYLAHGSTERQDTLPAYGVLPCVVLHSFSHLSTLTTLLLSFCSMFELIFTGFAHSIASRAYPPFANDRLSDNRARTFPLGGSFRGRWRVQPLLLAQAMLLPRVASSTAVASYVV